MIEVSIVFRVSSEEVCRYKKQYLSIYLEGVQSADVADELFVDRVYSGLPFSEKVA